MTEVVEDSAGLGRRVSALRPAWHMSDLSGFEYLPGGYSNRNYQFSHCGQRYVLRVPQQARLFVDRELEHAFYQAPGRVLVPTVEAFDPATGTMITHWLDGPLLAEIDVDSGGLVPYVNELHAGLPPCPRQYDPVSLAQKQLSIGTPKRAIVEFAASRVWRPRHTTACHNDLNPWNIIRSDTGHSDTGHSDTVQWVTLDWEWFGENDPLFDLVTLHQGLGADDARLDEMAMELVQVSDLEETRQRVRDCLAAFWLREYAWAHAEVAGGNDRAEIREQIRVSSEKLGEFIA